VRPCVFPDALYPHLEVVEPARAKSSSDQFAIPPVRH
jgi:hypothetical protein